MMKKFFKIATICSLAISLATANSAYASNPEDTIDDIINDSSRQYPVRADVVQPSGQAYAVDIHTDSQLTFHYQAIHDYNPDTFVDTYGTTGTTYPKGFVSVPGTDAEVMAATASRMYDAPRDGLEGDPDATVEGAWYGFDGVTNRIVVINRSAAPVTMSAKSDTVELANPAGYSGNDFIGNARIDLYLNGDTLSDDASADGTDGHLYAWQKRTLDLTAGVIDGSSGSVGAGELYNAYTTGNDPAYEGPFDEFILKRESFSTKGDDGGRFSACAESASSDVTNYDASAGAVQSGYLVSELYAPVTQKASSDPLVVANNSVNINGWFSTEETTGDPGVPDPSAPVHHHVGYALVYFDIVGEPFDSTSTLALNAFEQAGLVNEYGMSSAATKIGTITLTFTAMS